MLVAAAVVMEEIQTLLEAAQQLMEVEVAHNPVLLAQDLKIEVVVEAALVTEHLALAVLVS
jgi:hypothetical protein